MSYRRWRFQLSQIFKYVSLPMVETPLSKGKTLMMLTKLQLQQHSQTCKKAINTWLSSGLPGEATDLLPCWVTNNEQSAPGESCTDLLLHNMCLSHPGEEGILDLGSPPPSEWWVERAWALSRYCCAWSLALLLPAAGCWIPCHTTPNINLLTDRNAEIKTHFKIYCEY